MWSSDRRRILTLALAASLAACGFAPAEGPVGAGSALRGKVMAEVPTTRDGFDFVARIEDRLGRATTPDYTLAWTLKTEPVAGGLTAAGATTRFTLTGTATYRVTDARTGALRGEGMVEGFTSWFTTGTTIASLTSEEDARRRLMTILADRIVTRLYADLR